MGTTTDTINILLRVNGTSSYTTAMNTVTNSTNGFNNSVGSLISTLAKLVSAGAILKFSKQCIEAASDLQEVANVVDVTFGQRANVINDWAKAQAASFGLSETAAKRYAGTYGTMAKQFGRTGDEAVQMSIALTKLTGDVGSFYNMTDEAAATKLKGIFTGETEGLKSLGVVMTETNLNAYALNRGLAVQYKDMDENSKVALRYAFVMDKLSHAQGDFQRTSDGWANSVRTFKLELENMKVEIGNQLIPVAGYGLQLVNTGLRTIAPLLIGVAQSVKYYVEAWKQASEQTKTFVKISLMIIGIGVVVPKVIAMVRVAVRLLTIEITTLSGALNVLFGIAALAFAALAFAELSESAQNMKNIGESAETSSDAVDDLSESLDSLGESTQKLDTFLASFDEVNKVGGSSSLMSNLVNSADIANILGFSDGLKEANGLLGELNNSINSIDTSVFEGSLMFSEEWWEEKKKLFSDYWNYLKKSLKDGSWTKDFLTTWGEVDAWFQEAFPGWYKYFETFGGKIFDATEKAKEFLKTINEMGFNDFSFEGVGDAYQSFSHDDKGNPTTVAAWAMDNLFGLSKHAAGGYPNKGSLFLAGESGAELVGNFGGSQTRVLNSSQMSGGSESSVVFSPTIQIDGRKISAVVIDNINSMTRSSGRSPLIELGG